ncbi:uncharacterized protein PRCAT00000373001 [Priceomyces carsonii]|uniref:uncharacterized protein n=1 Tax=Priceomyces carsonii TaxID=28549 RepID=UPI002EDB1324|nr:unnamed protein product [Priceomyces carsonii]
MIRRLGLTLSSARKFSSCISSRSEFSHVVIGGGCVGVSIAAELQGFQGNNVLLVEKNEALGMETTSRNSEVIHAGLYYPKDSLKANLCIQGKQRIYDAHDSGKFQVLLQKCGKLVVAQDESEFEYLVGLQKNSNDLGVDTNLWLSQQVNEKFPLIRAAGGALESPTTGIISAHDYTLFFEGRFEDEGGIIGLNTEVVDIDYNEGLSNYTLTLKETNSSENFEITTDNVVNSGGLHAQKVSNLLLPEDRHFDSYFAKGSYFSYNPEVPIKASSITSKLIYPCPNPNASSLGTHLTLDLGGQIRFGPDLEWLDIDDANDIDYTASDKNIDGAYNAVRRYFPKIQEHDLQPSYSGVRPKIYSASENKKKFADFIIREEEGFPGFVNLIGIESPGLTASWAIGEYVKDIYHK